MPSRHGGGICPTTTFVVSVAIPTTVLAPSASFLATSVRCVSLAYQEDCRDDAYQAQCSANATIRSTWYVACTGTASALTRF